MHRKYNRNQIRLKRYDQQQTGLFPECPECKSDVLTQAFKGQHHDYLCCRCDLRFNSNGAK